MISAILVKKHMASDVLPFSLHSRKLHYLCFCIILCFSAALLFSDDRVHAADNEQTNPKNNASVITASGHDLSVSFTYGFEKSSKYGRQMNIIAEVKNSGNDFSGTIGILSLPNQTSEQTLYEVPCIIAAGETKRIELTATVSSSNWPSLIIKDDKENTILQKSFRVIMTADQSIVFAGVLTDEPDDINYIGSTGLAKLFLLDETTLPSTEAGLDSLDVLLISNFNTDRLSKEQIEAILQWTKKGGMLVFGTGGTAAKTLSAFQGSLFNGTIGEPKNRTTLLGMSRSEFQAMKEELYQTINQSLDNDELDEKRQQEEAKEAAAETGSDNETAQQTSDVITSSENGNRISKDEIDSLTLKPMPKDMISMEFENFTPVLSEEDGFDLILKNNYGNGTVLAAAFELGMPGRYRTSMGTRLYHIIENNFSETKQSQLTENEYDDFYSLSNALGVNNISSYPHLKLYFFILLAYALFTGPILYFILKKLDKRHLLWGLMPASCLACTTIIYLIGGSSRITEPYIHYLSFLTLDQTEESPEIAQEVYFNVTAPYNKKYSITLPGVTDADIRSDASYGASYFYSDEQPKESSYYKTAIYKDGSNETTLIMNDYASFHAGCFYCTSQKESSSITGGFDTSLKLKKDFTATGTLTNHLGVDLHQAVYICNGQLYVLGSMKNGDTVSLKDCETFTCNSAESLETVPSASGKLPLEAIAGGYGWSSDNTPLERQLYFAYRYYLSSDSSLFSDNGRIIAATENGNVDFLEDTGLSVSGLQLLDIRLTPAKLNSASVESLEQSFVSVIAGNTDYPSYRYLPDEQIMTYYIREPETVDSLVYQKSGNAELISSSYNDYIFKGTVSAYNILTGEYDVIFTGGNATAWQDLTPYISAEGQLTLRYNTDPSNDYMYTIPSLYLLRK